MNNGPKKPNDVSPTSADSKQLEAFVITNVALNVRSLDNLALGSKLSPWGQAGLAALAAAGVDARAIVEEAAQRQLLPDGLSLILLGLKQKDNTAFKTRSYNSSNLSLGVFIHCHGNVVLPLI